MTNRDLVRRAIALIALIVSAGSYFVTGESMHLLEVAVILLAILNLL